MKSTFITRIADGMQLEWQLGDRYMEVEAPGSGDFAVLFESPGKTEEELIPTERALATRFAQFCNLQKR